jgi:hypothetical protein
LNEQNTEIKMQTSEFKLQFWNQAGEGIQSANKQGSWDYSKKA